MQLLFQLPCLGRVTRTMSAALPLRNSSKRKKSNFRSPAPPPYTHDFFWANLKVQLHLPPLRSLDLLTSPGTCPATSCGPYEVPVLPVRVQAVCIRAGLSQEVKRKSVERKSVERREFNSTSDEK